jgi:hypothetical protein
MRDVGPDIIIFTGAIVLIAYGSLVIATRAAIADDMNSLLGSSQKVANQQKPTLIDGSIGDINSFGSDIQNYVTYSYNGAIASVVVGVLQMVALLVKHAFRPSYYLGGRR